MMDNAQVLMNALVGEDYAAKISEGNFPLFRAVTVYADQTDGEPRHLLKTAGDRRSGFLIITPKRSGVTITVADRVGDGEHAELQAGHNFLHFVHEQLSAMIAPARYPAVSRRFILAPDSDLIGYGHWAFKEGAFVVDIRQPLIRRNIERVKEVIGGKPVDMRQTEISFQALLGFGFLPVDPYGRPCVFNLVG